MLFSRPAARLFFFLSSFPVRWRARSDDGGRGRARGSGPRGELELKDGIPVQQRQGPEGGRRLQVALNATGDTTDAALAYGLPFCTSEYGLTLCNIGCPSKFYTVDGTGGDMTASLCGGPARDTVLVVRQGSTNSSCSELTCVGMYLPMSRPRLRAAPLTFSLMIAAAFPHREQRARTTGVVASLDYHWSRGVRKLVSCTTSRLLELILICLEPTPSK
jgi:hypothetical protein